MPGGAYPEMVMNIPLYPGARVLVDGTVVLGSRSTTPSLSPLEELYAVCWQQVFAMSMGVLGDEEVLAELLDEVLGLLDRLMLLSIRPLGDEYEQVKCQCLLVLEQAVQATWGHPEQVVLCEVTSRLCEEG